MPQRSVSREEQRSHNTLQLGEIQQIYRSRSPSASVLGFFATLTLVAAIIVLAMALPHLLALAMPAWASFLFGLGLALLILIVPAFLVFATIVTWRRDRHTITLYEQGIAEQRGKSSQAMHWRDICYLRHHVTPGPMVNRQPGQPEHSYEIEGTEKLRIRFAGEIFDHQRLFRQITQQATPYLLSQIRACFQDGQEVRFGDLVATPAGLELHQINQMPRRLPWREIEAVQIGSQDQIIIKQKDNRYTWFEGTIANTEAFHQFVKDLREHA